MDINELITALEKAGHSCKRDEDGQIRVWIEPKSFCGKRLDVVGGDDHLVEADSRNGLPWREIPFEIPIRARVKPLTGTHDPRHGFSLKLHHLFVESGALLPPASMRHAEMPAINVRQLMNERGVS